MKVSLSKAVIGVALSSLVMSCQTTAVTNSTKPVVDSDTSAVEKTIINRTYATISLGERNCSQR